MPAQQSKSMVDSHVQPGVAPHLVASVMEQQLEEHFFMEKGLAMRAEPGWILVQLKTECGRFLASVMRWQEEGRASDTHHVHVVSALQVVSSFSRHVEAMRPWWRG